MRNLIALLGAPLAGALGVLIVAQVASSGTSYSGHWLVLVGFLPVACCVFAAGGLGNDHVSQGRVLLMALIGGLCAGAATYFAVIVTAMAWHANEVAGKSMFDLALHPDLIPTLAKEKSGMAVTATGEALAAAAIGFVLTVTSSWKNTKKP